MANTQALPTLYHVDLLKAIHAFGTTVARGGTTKDTYKAALVLASATYNASSTTFAGTGEVSGAGYTAGGIIVTNATEPTNDGTTAHWTPSAALDFGTVTLASSFDCVVIYNDTQSDKIVGVYTFPAQTVNNAGFVLNMPTNDGTTGLLRQASA